MNNSFSSTPSPEDRGVLMRGGTVMTSEDGNLVPLSTELNLGNGVKVFPNGDVIGADGSKTRMQEGMMVDRNGIVTDKDGNRVNAGK